jgi:hypothetical protein
MGEMLGVGVTHFPGFLRKDDDMAFLLRQALKSNKIPAHLKDPQNWPAKMREEWGQDEGVAAAARHRQQVIDDFRMIRRRVEDFNPDFILIWGDDQYEHFTEECVPPFCIFMLDEIVNTPYLNMDFNPREHNIWGEPLDQEFRWRGHRQAAGYLTQKLIDRGYDMPYAYRLREGHSISHSFLGTLLYLDYDRTGFDIPVVPFHVNCYGSTVVRSHGGMGHLEDGAAATFDPTAPPPWRCFDIGRETARILRDSPWRVVLMASSSWSHAFLTEKNHWIFPDVQADLDLLAALRAGRYERFRELTLPEVEDAGQHEILNWVCLAGALHELNYRPDFVDYAESYVFNSDKCMAVFTPGERVTA